MRALRPFFTLASNSGGNPCLAAQTVEIAWSFCFLILSIVMAMLAREQTKLAARFRQRASALLGVTALFMTIAVFGVYCGTKSVTAWAQDYTVLARAPNFTPDSATTFLIDLSSPKTAADYAAGSSTVTASQSGFSGGAYQGSISFGTAQNFNASSWTVEMLLKVPSSSASLSQIALGGYVTSNASLKFLLESGWGAREVAYTWQANSSFLTQPYAGGNGRSLQANAVDQWVYVIFGMDYATQRNKVVVRSLTGELLNKDINFAGSPSIDASFLLSYPEEQRAAELLRRWGVLRTNLTSGVPSTISLGSADISLKKLKISNVYREDLLTIEPDLPKASATVWTPSALDPSRVMTSTQMRTVGYPGYNNFVNIPVSEQALVLTPGSGPTSIQLSNVPIGVYSFMVYGAVDPKGRSVLDRVWKPTPMEFTATDSNGKILNTGKLLLKQSFKPRRMQGFHLQVDTPSNVIVSFNVPSSAMETPWIQQITLVDQLEGLPDVASKTSQNLAIGRTGQLPTLTTARMARDDAIWAALPSLNQHLQVHAQVSEFKTPPAGVVLEPWALKALHGIAVYNHPLYTFNPVEFLNLSNGTIFPTQSIYSGVPWPGPLSDNGTGNFFSKNEYPTLATEIYNSRRAELLGAQYLLYMGAVTDSRGSYYGSKLGLQYFSTGDPEIGHDGAMALVRFAKDWPALEMSLHELRLSTHSPDFEFGTDWSDGSRRNGKVYYSGWSGSTANYLFETYDQLFPYIKDNQVFAAAVHRFIPWINTPQDVVRYLDRYLVWSSVRDVSRSLIDGASNVQGNAAAVLGPSPTTQALFDLTKEMGEIYPATGTFQELYANALSRSGVYYIASFMVYAFGDAQATIRKAFLQKKAKDAGVALLMDLSDVNRYPKVRSAGDFLLNMWVAGGFPFMVGDASGGPHTGREARMRLTMPNTISALREAFELFGDPRHAWVLKNYAGSSDPVIVAAAEGQSDPIMRATSRVVPDYGAIIETGESELDPLKKSAMTMRLGIGAGHAHNDYLDLNFFAMGLPVSVDLACRNEGDNWSRPSANWSFVHNHALAHTTVDPNGAGAQSGEPWLRAFAPPMIQASYVNSDATERLDRDAVLIPVGSSGIHYAFDVQRLSGRNLHTWSFHGAESNSLVLNTPMTQQTVRWIDRTLEGTHYTGVAPDTLQATWTMTRTGSTFPYTFDGGGTIQTVGAEPTVLGSSYNAALPPVNVRATLLGQVGAAVMQGSPYSKSYAYAFPFLWVQKPATGISVFPALYEWYRGNSPVIASVQIVKNLPLTVGVTLTSGQSDTIESRDDGGFSVVSRDSTGIQWAKLSSVTQGNVGGLAFRASAGYLASIVDIDYSRRTLTTSAPLTANPFVIAGNTGRRIYLKLRGSGTSYAWDDDLLVNDGTITSLSATTTSINLSTNQNVLFGGTGNRKVEAMTVTNEDGTWHFRNNAIIKQPSGAALSASVFTDANGDGFINAKTYEIGIGDTLTVPSEISIQRSASEYQIKSNVDVSGTLDTLPFSIKASAHWQMILTNAVQPSAPSNLRIAN